MHELHCTTSPYLPHRLRPEQPHKKKGQRKEKSLGKRRSGVDISESGLVPKRNLTEQIGPKILSILAPHPLKSQLSNGP